MNTGKFVIIKPSRIKQFQMAIYGFSQSIGYTINIDIPTITISTIISDIYHILSGEFPISIPSPIINIIYYCTQNITSLIRVSVINTKYMLGELLTASTNINSDVYITAVLGFLQDVLSNISAGKTNISVIWNAGTYYFLSNWDGNTLASIDSNTLSQLDGV